MNFYRYDASREFFNKLKEINSLLILAKQKENESSIYSSLIKSSVILLTAYFEVFLEDLIEEYITNLNSANLKANIIPETIKNFQSKYILELVEKAYPKHNEKSELSLLHLMNFWNTENVKLHVLDNEYEFTTKKGTREICSLNPINKFNYGKHGSGEIVDLFKRLNIDLSRNIQFANKQSYFDDFILKRNTIIHNGGKSLNITYQDVRLFYVMTKVYIKRFDSLLKYEEANLILINSDIER